MSGSQADQDDTQYLILKVKGSESLTRSSNSDAWLDITNNNKSAGEFNPESKNKVQQQAKTKGWRDSEMR